MASTSRRTTRSKWSCPPKATPPSTASKARPSEKPPVSSCSSAYSTYLKTSSLHQGPEGKRAVPHDLCLLHGTYIIVQDQLLGIVGVRIPTHIARLADHG